MLCALPLAPSADPEPGPQLRKVGGLDEREAPIRIEKTGRGRFRVTVDGALHRDVVG
jgi:hypothetical protein